MKVVILSKSDGTGGAAIVSYRLMEALREEGVDARMLVAEKTTGSPYVAEAFSHWLRNYKFLRERLSIFCRNGFNRDSLFKIDDGSQGLPLWRHPWVKEADAVLINWVNQGFLSLEGVRRIARQGKKIVWTMHDMWNFTGVCHHAGTCRRFLEECGNCPLLGKKGNSKDLSFKTWWKKRSLYNASSIRFVAVSSWLKNLAVKSSLLSDKDISLIPNAFPLLSYEPSRPLNNPKRYIIFGAARIDDDIKGFPIFKESLKIFREKYPELASETGLLLYGGIKDRSQLEGIALDYEYLGTVNGFENLRKLYDLADVVASTSHYENLPGTLIEGQAFGCAPVSFDRGGQKDIIDHLSTGYLVPWSDNPRQRAEAFADGLAWALQNRPRLLLPMRTSVLSRFSYPAVASAYLTLLQ